MKLLWKIFARFFIFSVLALLYLPIMMLVIFSFHKGKVYSFDTFDFGFDLYVKMFQNSELMEAVFNTFLVAIISAGVATFIATMACMGLVAMRRRSRAVVMSVNQVSIINASIVIAFSLMLLFVTLGMANIGISRLIITHMVLVMPFILLVILPRFRQLDQNLFEAAQDLGATPMQAFFKVIVPQLVPAMVTAFLLGFTLSLDDFVITQYNSQGIKTISTVVYNSTRRGVPPEYRALSAIIFVTVLAILAIMAWRGRKKQKKGGLDNGI